MSESAKNMIMMMMMMMMMIITMMTMTLTMISRSRRRGYTRTVTFGSVYKTPHLLQYCSISVHCHTANNLFRLPHSMLTVQQYFCTLSHSQQSVQAATQHVNSTAQKSPCMSFHW